VIKVHFISVFVKWANQFYVLYNFCSNMWGRGGANFIIHCLFFRYCVVL